MPETQPLLIRFGGFELDEANAQLKRHTQVLDVAPRAFSVLCELARRPGQLVTKDALLDAVWGHRHVSESVLKSAVMQLRAAFEDDAKTPRFIETASRRGYRFIASTEPGLGVVSSSRTNGGSATLAAGVPAVDCLDACAVAWSARRIVEGRASSVGSDVRDARGRPMRIEW